MGLKWTSWAKSDLARLYGFLAADRQKSAARIVKSLIAAPKRLQEFPRIGEQLDEFKPREVRRILVGDYEMRYEIREADIYILRIWHTREDRSGWHPV